MSNVIYVDFSAKKATDFFVSVGEPISPVEIKWFTAEGEIKQPIFQSVQEEQWEHM